MALPLLLAGEVSLASRVDACCAHVRESALPPSAIPRWDRWIGRLRHLGDSGIAELSLLAGVIALTIASCLSALPAEAFRWLAPAIHDASGAFDAQPASWWWYAIIAQPFFLFVLGRWVFRWCLWSALVLALPGFEPRVVPAHADGAGGFAFLQEPLFSFRFLVGAVAVALTSTWYDEIGMGRAAPATFAADILAFLCVAGCVAFVPYARFTPRLVAEKRAAERRYSSIVRGYVAAFEARWLVRPVADDPDLLGNSDFQSLADIGTSFRVVSETRATVPSLAQARWLATSAALPFLLIVFRYAIPAVTLFERVIRHFLGG